MVLWKAYLLVLLVGWLDAQDPNCDYRTDVQPNNVYTVQSPNYPQNYRPGVQCRWIATAPQGYQIRLDCSEIRIPQSQSCSMDRLMISKSGDPYLNGAERYCSTGSLSNILSQSTTMSIGLITSTSSQGGKFTCTVRALATSTTPQSCTCGYKKTNRIVGGVQTDVNEYPMMAGLIDVEEGGIKAGGCIVTNRHVLTAAHVVYGKQASIRAVVVGEHDVTVGDSPATRVYQISGFIIHPQFSRETLDNDIALVTTNQDMEFSALVGPVCLPFKYANTNFAGKTVTALGWGTTFIGGPTSKYLRKVDLQVISREECLRTNPLALSARQMCTYAPGKDACQDDSGGPMLYTDPTTGLQFHVGLISAGRGCASTVGINTYTPPHLGWIQENTYPYQVCVK